MASLRHVGSVHPPEGPAYRDRMETRELLTDAFERITESYADVARGLDDATLHHRTEGRGNSIAWLLWHLARIQDDHVAGLAGNAQAWHEGWRERFELPYAAHDTGYGHTSDQVAACRIADASLLVDYQAELHRRTLEYLATVDAAELDRVVDRTWDPPVTAGVRLVSIEGDCLQHLGQAAYVRGLLGA
jgi:hypothetical protein